jgi:hypothetical protein
VSFTESIIHQILVLYCYNSTFRCVSITVKNYTQFLFTAASLHSVMCHLLPHDYAQIFLYYHKHTIRYVFFTATIINPIFCSLLPQEYITLYILYCHRDKPKFCSLLPQEYKKFVL